VLIMSGAFKGFLSSFLLWCVAMKLTLWSFLCRVVKIVGGNLSGSKVVRGMVFGRERVRSFLPLLHLHTKLT
jgi:hypothetical protein